MLIISPQTIAGMAYASASVFAEDVLKWLRTRPEVHHRALALRREWVHGEIDRASQFAITSQDAVARFCRLRLLQDESWFEEHNQQEILQSARDGNLKVFQLECAQEGIGREQPAPNGVEATRA
jgi:hypothetical protein